MSSRPIDGARQTIGNPLGHTAIETRLAQSYIDGYNACCDEVAGILAATGDTGPPLIKALCAATGQAEASDYITTVMTSLLKPLIEVVQGMKESEAA